MHQLTLSPPQLPEGSNQLRQMQLRELAMLNGTLREDGQVRPVSVSIISIIIIILIVLIISNISNVALNIIIFIIMILITNVTVVPQGAPCTNCGATDHRSWQCQDKVNVTNNVICTK